MSFHPRFVQAVAVPLLTLRGLIKQPLAKLGRRLTDRASAAKTEAVLPRTFSEVLPWDDFTPAALAQLQELDDTTARYMPQVIYLDANAYILSHLLVHKYIHKHKLWSAMQRLHTGV